MLPITDPELTAHARAERQRVRAALAGLSTAALEDLDAVDEPGIAYRAPHRHDPEAARRGGREYRHWKQPFWKRRTSLRRDRVRQELMLRHVS